LPERKDDLALIAGAVRSAGQLALEMQNSPVKQWIKSDNSPVSEADIAVNDLLLDALMTARPDYGWLSEENDDTSDRLSAKRLFVVDPIDGTRAFLSGKTAYTVSVALVEDGKPVIGCVYNPAEDEFYQAVTGQGASCNGTPIRPSRKAELEGCRMLGKRDLTKRWPGSQPLPDMELTYLNSIAYRMCLVASGAWDAAVALTDKGEWDLAAADLIAREAGSLCTAHDGAPLVYNQPHPRPPSMICANEVLHAAILEHTKPLNISSQNG